MCARRILFSGLMVCAAACPGQPSSAPPPPQQQPAPQPGPSRSAAGADLPAATLLRPVFIDAGFGTLHQTFLQYGLTAMERSQVWSHSYKNRWVHWTGQLVKVSQAAVLFRQLASTSSYDVLVRIPRIDPGLRQRLTVGRLYNYVGRVDSYDDMFRTIYLEQGQIFDAGPDGVPGVLINAPPLSRTFPPPPATQDPLRPMPDAPSNRNGAPLPPT